MLDLKEERRRRRDEDEGGEEVDAEDKFGKYRELKRESNSDVKIPVS